MPGTTFRPFFLIPKPVMDAAFTLHAKLADVGVDWALGGDLGEALRVVEVHVHDVEILTSKEGTEAIAAALAEFNPSEPKLLERKEERPAKIEGREYPVLTQSYYSELKIKGVPVKIYGDLRYKVGDWEWGDPIVFEPEVVNWVGLRFSIEPITLRRDLYRSLGWFDRMRLIAEALQRAQSGDK